MGRAGNRGRTAPAARARLMVARLLLGFCAGAAIGWAASATARDAEGAVVVGRKLPIGETVGGSVDLRGGASVPAFATSHCELGRACTGTAGCAGDCDVVTSLIAGCARCEKGAYAGCSQGECQVAMDFVAAAADEPLCPNQLMPPCLTVGEMCTIGRTSHRCRCSSVGPGQHPKWICK